MTAPTTGTTGNDTLIGTSNADTFDGQAGNDLFIVASASDAVGDVYLGGAGNDELRFTSTMPGGESFFVGPESDVELITIGTGTGATPVATGTQPIDVIATGMATAVTIVGNAGANMLVGGDAGSTLIGAAGADTLTGGDGNDRLDGGAGADYADGGSGNDTYVIANAADFTAADTISDSGDPADTDAIEIRTASGILAIGANVSGVEVINLVGATASAGIGVNVAASVTQGYVINGNGAGNAITGGSGNDTITGGSGGDTMVGGAGDDLFVVTTTAEATGDKYLGGAGTDIVLFAPTTLQVGAAATFVVGAAAATGIEAFEVGGSDAYNISVAAFGAAAGTKLVGNDAGNILTGGAGADTLVGGGGNDTLVGGAGLDAVSFDGFYADATVNLQLGTATSADAGNDNLTGIEGAVGGYGNDSLAGNASANRLDGGFGNDTIAGGAGADTLLGGYGNDVFLVDSGKHGLGDSIDGGAGQYPIFQGQTPVYIDYSDRLFFTSQTPGDTLTIGHNIAGIEFFAIADANDNGASTIALNVNAAAASSGIDLMGNDGANVVVGSAFADIIGGAGGNDRIDGRAGNDTIDGGDGNDTLSGVTGNDSLLGGNDDDRLDGGAGNDVLDGGAGNNMLLGGAGNDTLLGAGGNDTLVGGAGDDAYLITGHDVVTELAGGGQDTIATMSSVTLAGGNFEELLLTAQSQQQAIQISQLPEIDIDASAVTTAFLANMNLFFNSQFFPITAKFDLIGGHGNDTLIGSAGADTLVGGAGDDSIYGGGGNDLADYSAATGALSIDLGLGGASGTGIGTDALANIEKVSGGSGNDSISGDSGNNTISGGSGDDSLSGGVGFDSLSGDAGNDTLDGGGGFDNLTGGAGNDVFAFSQQPQGAVTTIADFTSGQDSFNLSLSAFAGLSAGVLDPGAFRAAADLSTGGGTGQYILYNSGTGALYYDANADGDATDAVQFAVVQQTGIPAAPTIAATDFHVV